ncbi:MAG: hypothetical protein IJ463_00220 [Bacilli bacterium]|nr:hypothetical protein [Bacilli bacterium]
MALTERYIGRYVSAESASNYIDAKGIIESANSIKTELEEFSNFAGDVKTAGSDLTPKTLCIDGLDCSPLVEDVATLITEKYTTMIGNLDSIIAAAEKVYNTKQDEYNQSARYRDQQEANRRAAMNSRSN